MLNHEGIPLLSIPMAGAIYARYTLRGWKNIGLFLGFSPETVRKWAHYHAMPVVRFHRQILAKPQDLERWLRLRLASSN